MTWWPVAFVLHIAVLERRIPGASIAIGYGAPLMLTSWGIGVGLAVSRLGGRAGVVGARVVAILAALPLPLILLRFPVWLASFF